MVFVCHRTVSRAAVYQLKIKYDQDKIRSGCLDAFDTIKRAVSFPLEDKHIVNEHYVIRKNVLTWCISMYHVIGLKQTRGIKNVTLKAAKKFVPVSQSTGKSNSRDSLARTVYMTKSYPA